MSVAVKPDALVEVRREHHATVALRRRRRWRRLTMVLIGLIAVAFVAVFVVSRVQGLTFQPVLSGSMEPSIRPGDLAVLRPAEASALQVGDVVAYLPPNHQIPVVHRIVSLNGDGMVTKGDANPTDDPWGRVAPQSESVTQLIAVVPSLGWLAQYKTEAMFVLAGLALVVIVLFLLPDKRRDPAHKAGAATDAVAPPSSTSVEEPHEKEN